MFSFDALKKAISATYDWEFATLTLVHADGTTTTHTDVSLATADQVERELTRRNESPTPFITVSSSAILGYEYNPQTEELTVRYKHGKAYTYPNIDTQVFAMLQAAGSKGSFIYHNIQFGGRKRL